MKHLLEKRIGELYLEALKAVNESDVPYMLGGAFSVYYYTGWWRDTHDIDIYTTPDNVEAAADGLRRAGFEDLGEQAHGDRAWIYHAGKDSVIVDVIFRFANLVNFVSPDWFERAPKGYFLDLEIQFLPLEELLWAKVFVINRHRCDWPDLMRIIRAQCRNINWNRLLDMLDEHWLLLAGLIDVFDWQHPGALDCIPTAIREELAKRREEYQKNPVNVEREHLLDPWLHHRTDRYAAWSNEQPDG